MASDPGSALSGLFMGGGGNAPPPSNRNDDTRALLMRLMYQRGKGITMRTRLNEERIKAVALGLAAARHVGYDPLEELANIFMECFISDGGQGRKEFGDFHRSASLASPPLGAPPRADPALEG